MSAMLLPLAPGVYAVLESAFPITESQWERMLIVLEAMKPGLTLPTELPAIEAALEAQR